MWYKVNFDKLQLLQMPVFLRKSIFLAFVSSCYSPLKTMYNTWLENREERLYELGHNGQVCYLRKALNDRFDNINRRIQLGDGNQYPRTYIYTRVEKKPKYLGQLILYSNTDYSDTGVDFIVYVPVEVVSKNPYAIEALVNKYKQDVKRFKIVSI